MILLSSFKTTDFDAVPEGCLEKLDMDIWNLSVECKEIGPEEKPESETFHLFDVCLGAHPGGGDYRTYVLEKIDSQHWKLWLKIFVDEWDEDNAEDEELGAWLFGLQASCESSSDAEPSDIAKSLIARTWIEEQRIYDTEFSDLSLEHAGLLSSLDQLKPRPNETL